MTCNEVLDEIGWTIGVMASFSILLLLIPLLPIFLFVEDVMHRGDDG